MKLDLTGQQFGYLSVLLPAGNENGKTVWRCRCVCGKELTVQTRYLRSGKTTNCGCRRKKRGVEQMHYIDGTCLEMLKCKTVRSNNHSGHPGVFYDRTFGQWRAEIMLQGKRKFLGRYPDIDDAIKAREKAEFELHQRFIEEHNVAEA